MVDMQPEVCLALIFSILPVDGKNKKKSILFSLLNNRIDCYYFDQISLYQTIYYWLSWIYFRIELECKRYISPNAMMFFFFLRKTVNLTVFKSVDSCSKTAQMYSSDVATSILFVVLPALSPSSLLTSTE